MKYFELQELVDKKTYTNKGYEAWNVFIPEALDMLEGVREFLNTPLIINNWHKGGVFQYSGYRPPECKIGAKESWHRECGAFDCKSAKYTAEEMRQKIIKDQDNPLLKYITRIEADVDWLHIDNKPLLSLQKRIYLFHV